MEAFVQGLLGENFSARDYEIIEYEDGLRSIYIPPSRRMLRALREQYRSSAKNLNLLANGNSIIQPSGPSSIVTNPNASCFSTYRFWWVILNLGTNDITASTTRQLKGKPDAYKLVADVTYPAGIINVYWNTANKLTKSGIKTHITKVDGAGKIKSKLLANSNNGCA